MQSLKVKACGGRLVPDSSVTCPTTQGCANAGALHAGRLLPLRQMWQHGVSMGQRLLHTAYSHRPSLRRATALSLCQEASQTPVLLQSS